MFVKIKHILRQKSAFREIIVLAFPLIISTGAWTIQHFVDRMFLAWYSTESIAASMPAGILNMLFMSVFIGTAGFTETFIAQYYGARQYHNIGTVMWHGIYISIIGGIFHLLLIPVAVPIFHAVGHNESIAKLEIAYFQTLCLGAFPTIANSAVAGFFAGRGKPRIVMAATLSQTAVNILFDYLLIFGKAHFPELGIKGAGIASVISAYSGFIFLLGAVSKKHYEDKYRVFSSWNLNRNLLMRIFRFGVPSGLQGTIDHAGFSIFLLLLGRLSTIPLAATNIAFNINTLAFMPMIGIGMAVSILVGQNLGANNPEKAEQSAWTGFVITFIYMVSIAVCYVAVPDIFIRPFSAKADPQEFEIIHRIAVVLLRFVAFYSVFDAMNVSFASALRGAGDTRYIMMAVGLISVSVLIIPSWIFIVMLQRGLYACWVIATMSLCSPFCS